MKVLKFVPSAVKDKLMKGHLMVEMPNYVERLRYMQECKLVIKDGSAEVGGSHIDALIKMIEASKKHVKEVELEVDKDRFTKFDELLDDPRFDSVINEVAAFVVNGVGVGKN